MDVTWERAFGSSTSYAVAVVGQEATGTVRQVNLSTTISATAVRFMVGIIPGTVLDLAEGGMHFMAVGI